LNKLERCLRRVRAADRRRDAGHSLSIGKDPVTVQRPFA
jgi:hypothetical protein